MRDFTAFRCFSRLISYALGSISYALGSISKVLGSISLVLASISNVVGSTSKVLQFFFFFSSRLLAGVPVGLGSVSLHLSDKKSVVCIVQIVC